MSKRVNDRFNTAKEAYDGVVEAFECARAVNKNVVKARDYGEKFVRQTIARAIKHGIIPAPTEPTTQ